MRCSLRRWFTVRSLFVGSLLFACTLLSGCEPEPQVTLTRPTPTGADAADQTPESKGTPLATLAPEELARRLLGGIEPLPGLPPAYAVETTEILPVAEAMPKLERAVRYTLKGPDLVNTVTYYLHASEEDAHEDLGTVLTGPFPSERLDGLGYQARVVTSGSPTGDVGTTRIYILAGQVIIESVSSVAQETPSGNILNATELARVAIAHLVAVAPP